MINSSERHAAIAQAADEEIAAWSALLATPRKVRRVVR
jgi:hypothetical protein